MQQTMLAAVWDGGSAPVLTRRPVPVVHEPGDAIVQVTRSTICTSDLHILHGAVPRAVPGIVLGHEFAGRVVAVGPGVTRLRPGDRVAANCESFCGDCWFCRRGYVNNCEQGGWLLGCRIDGCQAEYVRVPFADQCLYPLPHGVSEESALFVGDILVSGYWGALQCDIRPGDTVAVVGGGPVGLCAAQCARFLGAGRVVLLEPDPARRTLALAQQLADHVLDPCREDAPAFVQRLTGGRGADSVIEAAGAPDTFELAWRVARPNAVVSVVAMYESDQILPLPRMYGKNLIFKTGGVDANCCPRLVELIAAGKLRTDFLITHRGPLEAILDGYRTFAARQDGCLKWVVTGPCKTEESVS